MSSPIGEPMHWNTPKTAMPCVRSSRGMRSMTSAWIGALTFDMKNPARAIPANGTIHVAGTASSQSDAIWKMNATEPSVSGWKR